jgi:hypothetical protein
MIKNLKNIIYLFLIVGFIFLITFIYFSNENIKKTNKIRSTFKGADEIANLLLLKNNTNDIIQYTDEIQEFKEKKKKYKFFELLESNK